MNKVGRQPDRNEDEHQRPQWIDTGEMVIWNQQNREREQPHIQQDDDQYYASVAQPHLNQFQKKDDKFKISGIIDSKNLIEMP